MNLWFIVPAAGSGQRFGAEIPKQYQPLAGETVIERTLSLLLVIRPTAVVVAVDKKDSHWQHLSISKHESIRTVMGGATRASSVRNGLKSLKTLAAADDWILVHDVARPCITAEDLLLLVTTLKDDPVGGILAAPLSDTIKRVADKQNIEGTEDRTYLWSAMTPQMFRYQVLCDALDQAKEQNWVPTDESSAIERMGFSPRVIMGRRDNIKITRREDLAIAEAIINFQTREL